MSLKRLTILVTTLALLPLTAGATTLFGYPLIGGTTVNFIQSTAASSGFLDGAYTASAGDVFHFISLYGKRQNASNATMSVALYTFSGGVPVTRVTATTTLTYTSTIPTWATTTDYSYTMTAGTSYVVAFGESKASPNSFGAYYDDPGTGNGRSVNGHNNMDATWSSGGVTSRKYSVYGTVTAGVATTISSPVLWLKGVMKVIGTMFIK